MLVNPIQVQKVPRGTALYFKRIFINFYIDINVSLFPTAQPLLPEPYFANTVDFGVICTAAAPASSLEAVCWYMDSKFSRKTTRKTTMPQSQLELRQSSLESQGSCGELRRRVSSGRHGAVSLN
jgi:hypothetical protein